MKVEKRGGLQANVITFKVLCFGALISFNYRIPESKNYNNYYYLPMSVEIKGH